VTPFDGDREKLYERINQRVLGMFEVGLVYEVQSLMKNENNVQHKASAAADKKHKEGNCILPP
jgi:tRNA A37 N6-isopentenylltransferase MiaA